MGRFSKFALFYAVSGIPVGFKGYVGVLIHLVLYLTVNALDWLIGLSTGLNVFGTLHYRLYVLTDVFTAVFNPFLFACIEFNCVICSHLALLHPLTIIAITILNAKIRN